MPWPRPGRIFAAARSHTFKQLADAIDVAFARWDRSHLQEFALSDGRRLCDPDPEQEIEDEVTDDYKRLRLSRLRPGEKFTYVFDPGDDWAHLCTVAVQGSTRPTSWGSCPARRCPTGDGAIFPTVGVFCLLPRVPRIYSSAVIQVVNFLEREQPDCRPSKVRGRDIGVLVCAVSPPIRGGPIACSGGRSR